MTTPLQAVDSKTIGSLAGSSVLVTGGAGFVGSHLASTLAELCEVTVLDDRSTGDPDALPTDVELVRGDVRDVGTVHPLVADADIVFHQAGVSDVNGSIRCPVEAHSRNATGGLTVLDAARSYNVRVVVGSTAAVYGPAESLPISETDRTNPVSPFGTSKLATDQYARQYATYYDVPTVVLRSFNVYGPGHHARAGGVVDTFLDRARRDAPLPIYGDGAQTRDFVHVDDVVQANLLAAVTDAVGQAYNVGTGTAVTTREIAETVISTLESASSVVHRDPRRGDVPHSRADLTRAREDLGYEPTVDLLEWIESSDDLLTSLQH